MSLIDLTIDRPAWKRTEIAAQEDAEDSEPEASDDSTVEESTAEDRPAEASGRGGKKVALLAVVATIVGATTLRKFRQRRGGTEGLSED